MRGKKVYFIRWAILVLLLVIPACVTRNVTPSASNFYMATDEGGTNRTNIFSPTQDFYVFFDVDNIEPDTEFQSRWYALNIEGYNSDDPFQTIDYIYEEGIGTIYFQLQVTEPWPVGDYRVEVYMDGTEVGEQEFSVQ